MTSRIWLVLGAAVAASITAAIALLGGSVLAATVDEPAYTVESRDGAFEVRRYGPIVVAETTVDGAFDAAGSEGFRRLVRFISGDNQGAASIAMTAPVTQAPVKIAMTAPVTQTAGADGWLVGFVMPAGSVLARMPTPNDPRVVLRERPGRRAAVARFSGGWSEALRAEWTAKLAAWTSAQGLTATGDPEVHRYDPPWTLPALRRNEIHVPVDG